MDKLASTKAIKASQHQLKKSLGQNFLNNDAVVMRIKECVNPDLALIEIGPGIGALTQELLTLNQQLLCIELDDQLIDKLQQRFSDNEHFSLWHQDCLTVSNDDLVNHFGKQHLSVVANIPYYITTPIIKIIIDRWFSVDEAVLMVQDEVAKRVCSEPGNKTYGSLSVYVQTRCDVCYEFKVDKTNFVPAPKVDSAIIKLIKNDHYQLDWEAYSTFLQNCFCQKRKTLLNNLANSYNIDKPTTTKWLAKFGLIPTVRAEEISVDKFVQMFLEIEELR